ncbi:enhancer of polycomb homolog 1-like [Argiope bruennichi]|uniref:Enhancer of polycomb-like protein n=1 Tax=Argiope bruennichi TaxID=94029 RepID=A0A8T0ES18_ARGBR|nr:enhancer of polycomb homolog 1-like [Argiope bruennichi]KAF8778161.1 Enhancer of polycomb like protein [Argiope bruennichi]
MSKLSFRARALDASKPMPIYYMDDVPEFQDFTTINRAVPQMPTGMEKEEECEHHLQRAISAQQAYGHTGELVIPTPEVYNVPKNIKDELYPATYKSSRQLIHVQPFSMDQDIPDYDIDSEDEKWLSQQAERLDIRPLQYEEMMDRLEKSSGQQVITLKEAKLLLRDDDDIIIAVYDYWLNKRLRTQHPLIPQVKTEKRDGSTNNNPYVAFRRRTEKMQTRKNRKNDEASYEKMLKLRRDLSRAVTLLELVKRREKTKRELLHLTVEIMEKRYQAQDFSGQLLAEVSAIKHQRQSFIPVNSSQVVIKPETRVTKSKPVKGAPAKKRQYKRKKPDSTLSKMTISNSHGLDLNVGDVVSSEEDALSLSQSDQDDDNDPDGPYAFRRKKNCNYHEPRLEGLGNWPWCSAEEGGSEDKRYRFCLTSIPNSHNRPSCIGFARRRIGRGGRIVFDRAWSPLDDHLSELDNIALSPPNGLSSSNELITEIRTEWKFFRPKTSSASNTESENPDNGNGASNEFSRCRAESSTNKTLTNENPVVDFVKNYLNQEDELFEMQRKQLERLKPDESQSIVLLDSDHSYSSLPTSCFNVAPTPSKPLAQYHLVSAEFCDENDSSNISVQTTTSAPLLQLLDTSSITSNVGKVALTNGPVVEKGGDGLVNDSSTLERHRKEILGTSIESLVNYSQNSVVNSCLPAVPSIDLGGGAASHSSDTIHVINSKTFSTPQSALRFSNIEQNGNETRLKQELFLTKVKVDKVTSESSVSMDVT